MNRFSRSPRLPGRRLALYLRYAVVTASLMRDLVDPVAAPFAALATVTPMLLAAEGLYPHAPSAGRALFDAFLVLTVLLGGWFTGQWIYGDLEPDTFHPGYFLPTVAGGLVAAVGAGQVGQQRLGEAMFGLGLICWLVLGSVIMGRLLLRPVLPPPLLPTLAIEVAPPAVASLAYFALRGVRIDAFAAAVAGYGMLIVLAQLRLLPAFLKLRFMPGTWAFTLAGPPRPPRRSTGWPPFTRPRRPVTNTRSSLRSRYLSAASRPARDRHRPAAVAAAAAPSGATTRARTEASRVATPGHPAPGPSIGVGFLSSSRFARRRARP